MPLPPRTRVRARVIASSPRRERRRRSEHTHRRVPDRESIPAPGVTCDEVYDPPAGSPDSFVLLHRGLRSPLERVVLRFLLQAPGVIDELGVERAQKLLRSLWLALEVLEQPGHL
jgi:hypothetical protein